MPVASYSGLPSARFYLWVSSAFVVAVAITIGMVGTMSGGMEMPGGWTMSMIWMRMPGQSWLMSAAMFLLMWLAMMVAMMLPPLLPVLMRFHTCLIDADIPHVGLSTALVACGYFAVWTVIGAVAYVVGVVWALAPMRWPALSAAVPALTGAVLTLAGVLQFSRWKLVGLGQCRNPAVRISPSRDSISLAGWLHGLHQGWSCGICCAGPMLALLALGAMNPWVMLAVTGVIAAEKLLPKPQLIMYLTGVIAIASGSAIIVRSII